MWSNGLLWGLFGRVDDQFVVIGHEPDPYYGFVPTKLGTWSLDDGLTKYSLPEDRDVSNVTGEFTEYNDAIYFLGSETSDGWMEVYKITPGEPEIEQKQEFDGAMDLIVFNDGLVVLGYTTPHGDQSIAYYDENDDVHWLLEDSPYYLSEIQLEDDYLLIYTRVDEPELIIDSNWDVSEIPSLN